MDHPGEYSGAPNEQQTYDYARTILSLMTRVKDPRGKVLIVGGGIANFTDVAATFKGEWVGRTPHRTAHPALRSHTTIASTLNPCQLHDAGIITALRSFQEELREHNITIWVRRAGPNYQEGLRIIRELGKEIRVPIKVSHSPTPLFDP